MAKKKTIGPNTPAEQSAPSRGATPPAPRRRAAARPDTSTGDPGARPAASEPIDHAADVSVGAGSSDSAAAREPTYDEIAEAAYRRYVQRGGSHGSDFDDWLEAERSLRSRR